MVAPDIDVYGNEGTEAAPSAPWTDIDTEAGFVQMLYTAASKANMPIPGAGTTYTAEVWIDADTDAELLAAEADIVTEDWGDNMYACWMRNNDTNNDFTSVDLTIWDDAAEGTDAKAICDTSDTTVLMRAASSGYFGSSEPTGVCTTLGPWTYTTIGGATKIDIAGGVTPGTCPDGASCVFVMNVGVTSTAVPGDNTHYMTIGYSWT